MDLGQSKFKPESIVLCEVQPVQNNPDDNKRTDKFNKLLHEKYNSMEGIQILEINKMVKSFQNPRQLYYDNIHFNNSIGLPSLRNCLLSQLLKTSTGVCNKRYSQQLPKKLESRILPFRIQLEPKVTGLLYRSLIVHGHF